MSLLWLGRQSVYFPYRFRKLSSLTSDLKKYNLENPLTSFKELIVIDNYGKIYKNENAFIMCLFATRKFRAWSIRLSRPMLKPLTKRFFTFLSNHRGSLSFLLKKKDKKLNRVLLQYIAEDTNTLESNHTTSACSKNN